MYHLPSTRRTLPVSVCIDPLPKRVTVIHRHPDAAGRSRAAAPPAPPARRRAPTLPRVARRGNSHPRRRCVTDTALLEEQRIAHLGRTTRFVPAGELRGGHDEARGRPACRPTAARPRLFGGGGAALPALLTPPPAQAATISATRLADGAFVSRVTTFILDEGCALDSRRPAAGAGCSKPVRSNRRESFSGGWTYASATSPNSFRPR